MHALYKIEAPFNGFVLIVNHTKMGLNLPHLGQRRISPLPSLQNNADIPAPTTGTTILMLTIMNFVESIRSNSPLARNMHESRKSQILRKPGHSCFESHQSSMKRPDAVLCFDIFSPNCMDCTKAMAPGDCACGTS